MQTTNEPRAAVTREQTFRERKMPSDVNRRSDAVTKGHLDFGLGYFRRELLSSLFRPEARLGCGMQGSRASTSNEHGSDRHDRFQDASV